MSRPKQRKRQKGAQSLLLQPVTMEGLRGTMAGYLEAMALRNMTRSTRESRASELLRFCVWCEERGLRLPAEVTKQLLERYQRHLFYYRRADGRPLSASSQQHQLIAVRQYFRWLARKSLLPANPASELELPKLGLRLPRDVLSPADVEKVLAVPDVTTLDGLRDRAILELFWATGLRRGEMVALGVWDAREDAGAVFVRQGKGRKDRVVPASKRSFQWLKRYLEEVRPRLVVPPDNGVVFLSTTGEPLSSDILTHLVSGYVKASAVRAKGSCHLFRHACATAMLEAGADIRFVQELLGHAMLETTQIYTRVSITKLKAVYEATHPSARPQATAPAGGEEQLEPAALLEQLALEPEAVEETSS